MTSYGLLIAMVSIFIIGCISYFVSESKNTSGVEKYEDADEYKVSKETKDVKIDDKPKKARKSRRSKLTKF